MDGYIILTIVATAGIVLVLQHIFKAGAAATAANKTLYREEAFADIIRINDESLLKGSIDSLTGLPDRLVFDERLKKILIHSNKYSQIFSLMVLNLDEFNLINQIYGSVFGNKLLAETANRMRTVIRQIDTVSRYAGDNFYFILPELSNPEIAMLVAQRIQDSIIQPFNIEGHRIFITACLGITIYDPSVDDSQLMINKAQDALAKAKLAGRNTYRIHQVKAEDEKNHYTGIIDHILNGDIYQMMTVSYQPYTDVKYNAVNMLQALPYLQHPEHGSFSYDDIYQAMESVDQVSELGEWQLQKVLEQMHHWAQNEFNPDYVIINMNIRQLENPDYIHRISKILDAAGDLKHKLVFDISGSAIKSHHQSFGDILQVLQDKGVKLSASLIALGRIALHNILKFPINFLKIDEKIVKNLMINVENDAIIATLISASQTTDVIVIADGVDFETQKDKLLDLGCSIMKGKLFHPAADANEIFDYEMTKKHESHRN